MWDLMKDLASHLRCSLIPPCASALLLTAPSVGLWLVSPWVACGLVPVMLAGLDQAHGSAFTELLWWRTRARGTGCAGGWSAVPRQGGLMATATRARLARGSAHPEGDSGAMGQGRLLSS